MIQHFFFFNTLADLGEKNEKKTWENFSLLLHHAELCETAQTARMNLWLPQMDLHNYLLMQQPSGVCVLVCLLRTIKFLSGGQCESLSCVWCTAVDAEVRSAVWPPLWPVILSH